MRCSRHGTTGGVRDTRSNESAVSPRVGQGSNQMVAFVVRSWVQGGGNTEKDVFYVFYVFSLYIIPCFCSAFPRKTLEHIAPRYVFHVFQRARLVRP